MSIEDGYVSVMDNDTGETREDLKLPDDTTLRKEIEDKAEKGDSFLVTVLKACDEEAIVGTKVMT